MDNDKIITFEIPKGYVLKESHPDKLVYERIDQPTSLDEACNVINVKNHYAYRYSLLETLQRLLMFRDAWWKVADDWKPDWCDEHSIKYIIYICQDKINVSISIINSQLLAFPTAEMRDAFCENFKELINEVKELL